MRLFVAIRLGTEVEGSLRKAMNALRRQGQGNFTGAENLHLTLAFLGEVPSQEGVIRALEGIRADAFDLQVEGIGKFNDLYWAGMAFAPELNALQKDISERLRAAHFHLDTRAFKPHLTLCREFKAARGIVDTAAIEKALGTPQSHVSELLLMRSSRENGRLVYTPLWRKALQ